MFSENVNTELYFIYGLIIVVILLIVLVLLMDRKDAKKSKRRIKLTDTLNMKPITADMLRDSKYSEDIEVVDMMESEEEKALYNTKSIPEIKLDLAKAGLIRSEVVESNIEEEKEEVYHDTDLDKTQAQLRVEEITKALEDAKVDEKIEEEKDKYADYEEEQEKNAIISYEELKNSYDELYQESERQQYIDDNTIPINIKELYEINDRQAEYAEEFNKEDDVELLETSNKQYPSSMYGIDNKVEDEIQTATDFLTTLKELRNNL